MVDKLFSQNIMCIQYDDKTKKASLVIRNGDRILLVPLGSSPVRDLTQIERQRGDHRPDRH